MGYIVKPGDVVKSRAHAYSILEELNKGGFADAYKAQNELGQTVFLKQYKSPSKLVPWFKDYFKYEDEINSRLEKDLILKSASVHAIEVFLGKAYKSDGETLWTRNESIFQVFPFVKGNVTLEELISKDFKEYDWEKRLYACAVFAFALRKLHDVDIIHCDLKPQNVQIQYDPTIAIKYKPLLIDMDWSILSDKTAPWNGYQGYVGTVGYNSPEHLKGEIPLEVSDVFTFAIITCQILAKKHPFGSQIGKDSFVEYVLSGENDFSKSKKIPFKGYVTDKFNDLILKALDVNPSNRPTMQELHAELMLMCKNHGKPDFSKDPNYTIFNNIKKVGKFLFGRKDESVIEDPITISNKESVKVEKASLADKGCLKRRLNPIKIKDSLKSTSKKTKVILIGDIGQIEVKIPNFNLDMNTLKRISTQAKFADSNSQFKIVRDSDFNWYATAGVNTANGTALNKKLIEDGKSAILHDNDIIALCGRSSGKMAMEINVKIVND